MSIIPAVRFGAGVAGMAARAVWGFSFGVGCNRACSTGALSLAIKVDLVEGVRDPMAPRFPRMATAEV